jgi:class 3 adenylate cyclase
VELVPHQRQCRQFLLAHLNPQRVAAALGDELRGIGLQIRVGLHTGEVELRDSDVGGIAVHLAARVMAAAGSGEILISRTVRDLVVGSNIMVEDRGPHALKGIEGAWQLLRSREADRHRPGWIPKDALDCSARLASLRPSISGLIAG